MFRLRGFFSPPSRTAVAQFAAMLVVANLVWRFRYYVLPVLPSPDVDLDLDGPLDGLPPPFLDDLELPDGSSVPGFCRWTFGDSLLDARILKHRLNKRDTRVRTGQGHPGVEMGTIEKMVAKAAAQVGRAVDEEVFNSGRRDGDKNNGASGTLSSSQGHPVRSPDWNSNFDAPAGDLTPLSPAIHALTESGGVTLPNRHYWQTLSLPRLLELRWEWQQHLRTDALPYPTAASLFGFKQGSKGIVTTMEGSSLRYALSGLRVLRRLNCSLDIEAWYYRGELTESQKRLIVEYGTAAGGKIVLKEAEEEAAKLSRSLAGKQGSDGSPKDPLVGGDDDDDDDPLTFFTPRKSSGRNYQLKIEAIMASSFEQVLWLDSDNVVASDPSALFDDPAYTTTGSLFWPDYWRTAVDNPIWYITGVPYRYEPEFEAGQLIISKSKTWCALSLALHFVHEQIYMDRFLWGDKDAFRYAWKATGTPFHLVKWPVQPAGPKTSDAASEFCATTMVQFSPHDRDTPLFFHANALKYSPALSPASSSSGDSSEGPFPYILRYTLKTDTRRMRPVGYRGVGGRWCVTLGGEKERGVGMEWVETDATVGEMWMEAWKGTAGRIKKKWWKRSGKD